MLTKDSWEKYLIEAHNTMIQENDTRELGKIRSVPAEWFAKDWINQNTNLKVFRRKEIKSPEEDKNESGYDLFCPSNNMRIQVKYRSDKLHLETTRRNSKKNKEKIRTGHVAYSSHECDMFVFVKPGKDFSETKFIAIPSFALEDPKSPGNLMTNVPAAVVKKYEEHTIKTLNEWRKNE